LFVACEHLLKYTSKRDSVFFTILYHFSSFFIAVMTTSFFRSLALALVCLAIVIALAPTAVSAQVIVQNAIVVSVQPQTPRWGDTVTITYNTKHKDAKLTVRDKAYCSLRLIMTDGTAQKRSPQASVQDSLLVVKYVVEDSVSKGSAAFMNAEFTHFQWQDEFQARRRDSVMARGAALSRIWSDPKAFAAELAIYPDNYEAYNEKWLAAQYFTMKDKPEQRLEDVRKDLKTLEAVKTVNASLLLAKANAHERLGQVPQQQAALSELLERFPHSYNTVKAFFRYLQSTITKNDSTARAHKAKTLELRQQAQRIIARDQGGLLAKEMLERFWADTSLTVAQMEPVMRAWAAKEPENPEPYIALLSMAREKKMSNDSLVAYAQRACDLVVRSDVRLKYHLDAQRDVYRAFSHAAAIYTNGRRFGQALSALQTARYLVKEDDDRGALFAKEASIWNTLEQPTRAQQSFLQAFALGSKGAKDSLKVLYAAQRGSLEGFEQFTKSKTDSIQALSQKPALPFSVKDLDGKSYDLAALRGKVVVLNFWFINCGPCRMEMPGLNKLVTEFAGKDVVFLSFALDEDKDLREFLKKTSFTYAVAPKAWEMSEKYGVSSYPTHVIINRKGMVAGRLLGGSETRHDELRPFIENALAQ
jgi:thiol-disulfide isomerase/thioredoxin